jgi:putative DNA methylase
MREEARKRIGHLYPPIEITAEMARERPDLKPLVGQKLTVIAWLWARTVKSPNPAFSHVDVPLVSTFILSSKEGKEAYVQPIVDGDRYRFTVKIGKPPPEAKNGTKLARGASFRCLLSGVAIEDKYIKFESMSQRMGTRLMAIVAEGRGGRVYLAPSPQHEQIARSAVPAWKPEQPMNRETRDLVSGRGYGFFTWADLFTPRQLVALTAFSDLVTEARQRVLADFQAMEKLASSLSNHWKTNDTRGIDQGGSGPQAYADLSDFFYVWLRRSLRPVFPTLLSTIAVPKAEELVAATYRHGSKEKAESFFLSGMTQAMQSLSTQSHPAVPITIYYAFKQADTEETDGTS